MAARVAGMAGVVLCGWLAVAVVRHGGRAEYDLPVAAVVVGLGAALLAAAGWALVAWRRDGVVLGVAVAALLLVGGVLALLSVGLLLLFAGVAVIAVVARAVGRRPPEQRPPAAVVAGVAVLVGLGLPAAALVATDGPIVRCTAGGVSTRSSLVRGFGGGTQSASGSSAMDASGSSTSGTTTSGGRTYRYRCDGGRLVEFVTVHP